MAHISLQVGEIVRGPFDVAMAHENDNDRGSIFLRVNGVSIQFSGTPMHLAHLGETILRMAIDLREKQEQAKMTPLV